MLRKKPKQFPTAPTTKPGKLLHVACVVLLGSYLAATGGCSSSSPHQAVPQQAASHSLLAVPLPDLQGLETAVRTQLRRQRAQLDAALQQPQVPAPELGAAFGAAGRLYHAYNLLEPAKACYLNAQSLASGDYRWPHYLGYIYQSQNEPRQAAAQFKQAVTLQPDYAPALIGLALNYLMLNEPEQAEPLLQQALRFSETKGAALAELGKRALVRRDYTAAVGQLEQALQLMPEATELNYPLAQAYRGQGETDKAEASLTRRGAGKVIVVDWLMAELQGLTTGAVMHLTRGSRLVSAKKYPEALAEFEQAVAADPDNVIARLNLGSSLVLAGRFEEARAQFTAALRLQPDNASAHQTMAGLLARLGDDQGVIKHCRAALAADAQQTGTRLQLGHALLRSGKFAEAADAYAAELKLNPQHNSQQGPAQFYLALAWIKLQRYAEARTQLEEIVKTAPGHQAATQALARLLAACPERTVRDGQRALALAQAPTSNQAEAAQTLAMAYAEAGQFELALRAQQTALRAAQQGAPPAQWLDMLKADLKLYERRQPCRRPWHAAAPLFAPPRPR